MIKLKGIYKSYVTPYQKLSVLKGIDLVICAGEMVSIMGSSGSGKTTLLNVMGLLDGFEEGFYWIDGKSVAILNEDEKAVLRNRTFGFVFQSANLIPQINILENVILPLTYRKASVREMREEGLAQLERLGLLEWRHHYPNELSGGQRQRVAIARAIINRPKIILADEPTGQLDSETTSSVMTLLSELNRELGCTTIIVTHDSEVAKSTQRIIRLKDGRICP